ncbi:MAG: hypothetical protein QOH96_1440 [Blastocatellia bacterium]|nr:hypothetical protein [Blastocatellia bacterium]
MDDVNIVSLGSCRQGTGRGESWATAKLTERQANRCPNAILEKEALNANRAFRIRSKTLSKNEREIDISFVLTYLRAHTSR